MSKLLHSVAATKKRVRDAQADDEAETAAAAPRKSAKASRTQSIRDDLKELIPGKYTKKKDKAAAVTRGKASKKPAAEATESSVIYLGHVAHGFYEKEMKRFFAQFGDIKRVKLFRSKKTGNSKGYAFIEFESAEVAKIVADAMNGYFLQERQLVCHVVPPSKLHEGMFLYSKKKTAPLAIEDGEGVIAVPRTEEQAKVFVKEQKKKMDKLKSLGIDFDVFSSLVA